jgi:eukaryotic-like serine/threonine-protein kinase
VERTLKKLGKYEVLGELGHGAMGVVYRARDPIINRLVALKTITTGVADDPALLQRFYREAQSAGGLQHPNIVTIYDMGEAGALPYIAMELVEGENLEQMIARGSDVPLTIKLIYAMQACRAFDYAHKRGIVHRDIKPGNVMVSKDGTIKVVDFGIARVLEASRTQTGMLIGTFAYMSPEQYHGEHADERSDIWSFGVLLYELLCYQRPFNGPTPASLMHSICNVEPALLKKHLPESPDELELLVSKMLRKSPAERYQSMEDVLLDLDPICKILQSQSVAELLNRSRQLMEQGSFAEAREFVRQALQVESGNQQARSILETANAELRRAQNQPKAQQFVETGLSLLSEGKLQEAKVAAENALQLDSRFAAAEDLRRAVQKEFDRARMLAEWLDSAKQYLVGGLPEEAEALLTKVLQMEPSNPLAKALLQQAGNEKAEREKRHRLLDELHRARELWTHQNYEECVSLLQTLDREFPGEEEVARLLETVHEDQLEHHKQQSLLESRNLLAAGRHAECISVLTELEQQFPGNEEIPGLLEAARKDEMNHRRLLGLAEARKLLAGGQYGACSSLLASLNQSFPEDQEIPRLLEIAGQNQAEQLRQRNVTEAGKLLSSGKFEECTALLTTLDKQFPGDEEVLALRKAVLEQRGEKAKQQRLEEAQGLLAARRYDECSVLLKSLENQFPGDQEVLRLQSLLGENRLKQRRLQGLEEARNLLSSKEYEKCVAQLVALQKDFPGDVEIRKLLESARLEQVDHLKREELTQARTLLAARQFDASIALLSKLNANFPTETAVGKLLESARREQAAERQREGVAAARSLLAARRYDESITLLRKLQADFPDETEITKLLATAREDLDEQEKQQKLAEARNLLAAQSFAEALAILNSLAISYPKDSTVTKLRAVVQREQEKQARTERLQHELDALKKLMGDKRYPEVISRAKELLVEFPSDSNLIRLSDFAASRQANIANELLLNSTLEGAKAAFDAGRYEDAIRLVQKGLKTFQGNAELHSLLQQCEIQHRKLEVRQQIERRIREIKVKINREELSDAISLAKQTLVTMGPDTDLAHLLTSAEVEFEAREKKKIQEQTLQTVRTLIDSGNIDAARRTMNEVLESQKLSSLDPRVQRLSERIKEPKPTPAGDPTIAPPSVSPSLSKEYAFLQAPPTPEVSSSPEKATVLDSISAQVSASQTVTPPFFAPAKPLESVSPVPELVVGPVSQPATKEVKKEVEQTVRPRPKIEVQQEPLLSVPQVVVATQTATLPVWRKPAVLTMVALAIFAGVWVGIRSMKVTPQLRPTTETVQKPAETHADPIELQQRQALDAANAMIAANDLKGAMQKLQDAPALKGPLTDEIQKRLSEIEKSDAIDRAEKTQLGQWEDQFEHLRKSSDNAAIPQLKALQSKFQTVANGGGTHSEEARTYLVKISAAINSIQAHSNQKIAGSRCKEITESVEVGGTLSKEDRAYLDANCH